MNSRLITAHHSPYPLRWTGCVSLLLIALGNSSMTCAQGTDDVVSFIELPWRYVIGGYANGQWLDSAEAGRLLTTPTGYRVFTLDAETAGVSGAPAAPDADVCPDVMMQALTPMPAPDQRAIGIHAAWNPRPRNAQLLNGADDIHQQYVTALLQNNGITKPTVTITQVIHIDLDGDGSAEELVAATHYVHQDELLTVEPGDYSFVALQRSVDGNTQTQLLSGEFYAQTREDAAPYIHEVAGVLDLNGDGVLEVLVSSSYYEGGGLKVWELQQDRLVEVLAIECGV